MKKNWMWFLAGLAVPIGAAAILLFLVTAGWREHQSQTVIVNHPVQISGEWLTLPFARPLVATAYWDQQLLASISSAHQHSVEPFGLLMPDGAVVWPEVEVRESISGQWLRLGSKGFYGEEASFSDQAFSGNGNTYVAVRLRSTRPITVSRLVWDSYDPKEVKR